MRVLQLDQQTLTKRWMRDASDELAVRNGCWFNWKRASYAAWWKERYCILYEGSDAGEPMRLRGLHSVPLTWHVPRRWNEEAQKFYQQRMLDYLDGFHGGEPHDWQYEWTMRLYGWCRYSDHWREPIRRFRSGSAWVPKKNKKSPSAAADALYIGCGDGEPGNHVGLCAKDGSQARDIVGKHALEMVKTSPELSMECSINLNEYQVTHHPSKSTIKPLSSSNERNTKAKEGFNGSLVVDECHVVDRSFMRRMTRAGISRKEPLHLEFSTSGNEPDGYGKERHDWGEEIARGSRDIDTHLHLCFEADQDTDIRSATDAELEAAARKANPALGHTVQFSELMADIKQSRSKASDAADCMMYRLNVWQTSASPWIPPYQWAECGHELNIADYRGRYAVVGFDFGSSRDFAAFVAAVPETGDAGLERLDLFPWIIAPRAYVDANREANTHFRDWEERGLLLVSPGDVIDLGYLFSVFARITQIFEVGCLFYDPYRAEELTQLISQGARSPDGTQVMEGFGVPRVKVGTKGHVMATAIEEFANRVRDKSIRHPRHEVLSSHIGNVNLKYVGSAPRMEKPSKDNVRKIDAAVASVIAFAGLTNSELLPARSVYESRGFRTL